MLKIDSLILDIDGTIWNSTNVVATGWNKAIEDTYPHVNRVNAEILQKQFGKPMNVIADNLFPELNQQQKDELLEHCCVEEHEAIKSNTANITYPNVVETIKKLSKKVPIYIVSNCQSGYIELVCEKNGITEYISDSECYGNNGKSKADNIKLIIERNNLKHPVYVGDTQGDCDSCKEAGVPFVFASYGFGNVDQYFYRIEDFSQLELLFESFDYLFFDLDGTLTDPALGITNSFVHAFEHFGLEVPSYETLCTFIGPPLVETFKTHLGFSEEKAMEGVKAYREYFADKGLFENSVYDGIEGMLKVLKEGGKHLVVATSKPEPYAIKIMEHFGLSKYFDSICGSLLDESRSKKAEVIEYALKLNNVTDKSKVLMIGDREHDIFGAQQNGLKSCGILFGYGNMTEFVNAKADFIFSDINSLKDFLS